MSECNFLKPCNNKEAGTARKIKIKENAMLCYFHIFQSYYVKQESTHVMSIQFKLKKKKQTEPGVHTETFLTENKSDMLG